MSDTRAYRASLFHLLDDPAADAGAVAFHRDGLLLVEDGHIAAAGDYAALAPTLADGVPVEHLPGKLITPGFIDTHIHLPQIDIVAAYGEQLLGWLTEHTFPAERAFADPAHAKASAAFFLDELLRNGTTTAMVFGSVHAASVEALFADAHARDMRLIAGQCLMDEASDPALRDTLESGRQTTERLIADWSRKGRLGYAVTPRFALSSSREQLTMAGQLLARHDHIWMQTHLSENPREIEAVAAAFPEASDYFDVYARHGLATPRSVFGHCVHTDDAAFARMGRAGCACAFCPTSNLFLGSGLFDLKRAQAHGVKVGLGTDIGAGTSFSLLATLGEAYKVGQLRGAPLDPVRAFHLATLGGARALGLDHRIGNFTPGKEADFLVLDPAATPLLARRTVRAATLEALLFPLMILGDDRAIARTYVAGKLAHQRN